MKTESKPKRPVVRYHGGKFRLAKWIISHFPQHKIYVDLFGGGGSVLMQKKPVYAEIYNDRWDLIVDVFRVLRDPLKAKELERVCRLTPFSRTEFFECSMDNILSQESDIERARMVIFRSFAGFGSASINGNHATGFRSNAHKNGTTPAHDWNNYPEHIKSFTERLCRVCIENRDYSEIINQHDSLDTLFYADPPYMHDTRNMARGNAAYFHEMTDEEHERMCQSFKSIRGMVAISGYENELYNDHLIGWHKSVSKAFADGARERTEVLWMNYKPAPELLKQLKLI